MKESKKTAGDTVEVHLVPWTAGAELISAEYFLPPTLDASKKGLRGEYFQSIDYER